MPRLEESTVARAEDTEFADRIINQYAGRPGSLLTILEQLQQRNPHRYLPAETLRYVAERTRTPLSRVYSVVTFYALFNLEPQGDNTICICRGTACHTRGSRDLLERLKLELSVGQGEDEDGADKLAITTSDRKFTLRTVACFGQCALAPVVEVNHRVCGHMNEQTLERELEALRKGSGR